MTLAEWGQAQRARLELEEPPWLLLIGAGMLATVSLLQRRLLVEGTLLWLAAFALFFCVRRGSEHFPARIFGVLASLWPAWACLVPLLIVRADRLAEASVLMTLQLFMASFEGYRSRSTPRAPYVPLAGGLTSVVFIVWVIHGPMRVFVALTASPAFLLQTLFGEFASVGDESHLETLRLLEALAAEGVATMQRARDLLASFLEGSLDNADGLAILGLTAREHALRLTETQSQVTVNEYVETVRSMRQTVDGLRKTIAEKSALLPTAAPVAIEKTGSGFVVWGQRWLKVLRDTSPGPLVDVGHMVLGFSAVIALGAWVPYTRTLIALHPWRPFVLMLVSQTIILFAFTRITSEKRSVLEIGFFLFGVVVMGTQCAFLVVDSSEFGAYIYGCFLPIVIGWGLVEARVSFQEPYMLMVPLAVLAFALPFAPTITHACILIASVALAALVGLVVSPIFREQDQSRLRQAELRAELVRRKETAPSRELADLAELTRSLAGRAHDVSGPLLAASVTASALEALGDSAPTGEVRAIAQRAVQHCEAICRIIADASSSLRGALVRPIAQVDLRSVVTEVLAEAREIQPDVRFELEGGDAQVAFAGGPVDLGRATRNVILNATKWARRRVCVRIESATTSLVVEDDGPGFVLPESSAEHLALGRSATGGIGLSITRQLLRATGGELSVSSSALLGGARVTMRFG